jgi:predicted acylesterase/phospholipase RssA
MGGLARELDNLRRACNALPSGATDDTDAGRAEIRLHELWQRHARVAGKRVIVDVIAGTSAGGLNGVLLSLAIANGVPLTSLRDLWLDTAGFGTDQLLKPQQGGAVSFLNGDFFLEHINDAIGVLAHPAGPHARMPVALTVTATALRGRPRVTFDSRDTPFDEPDHRRRFDFRYSPSQVEYRAEKFCTETRDDFLASTAVARAARASASFPVAFKPVDEIPELRARRSWPDFDTGDDLEWLIDGGVLDNSPFDPILQAIGDQPVSETWRRTLCYVVPSADEAPLGREIGAVEEDKPPPWTTAMTAAFGLPREADLRDDVEQMHALIRTGRSSVDVDRFRLLVGAPDKFKIAVALATGGFKLYQETRAITAVYDMRDLLAAASATAYLDPASRVQDGDVDGSHPWKPDAFPTSDFPAEWTWGVTAAARVISMFVRSIAVQNNVDDAVRRALSDVAAKAAAVRRALAGTLTTNKNASPDEPVAKTIERGDRAYSSLGVTVLLASLVRTAAETYAGGVPGSPSALQVLQAALCVEVLNGAGGQPVEPKTPPIFDFARFGLASPPACLRSAFTGDPHSAPAAADPAIVATTDTPTPSNILYGTRLSHFAAFGSRSWRAWDWMWGRLHAAVHLGHLLDLGDDDIDELARLIIVAELRTVQDVRAQIPDVLKATASELLDEIRAEHLVRPAVNGLFEMIAGRHQTEPAYPDPVRWAAVLSPYSSAGLTGWRRVVQIVIYPLRLVLRHVLRG